MAESRVPVGRLKAKLSEYLRRVQAGEAVVVTDRGTPVARLSALEGDHALEGRSHELIQFGMARAPAHPLRDGIFELPRAADPDGRSLESVSEERGEGW